VSFRSGVLIGVLATAVVALGVAVVLLATNDSSDSTGIETVASIGPPCQLESMGGEVEIELSSEAMSCAESRGVYTAYKEAVRSGKAAGIGGASEVDGWSCREYPLAEYPLIVRCRQGTRRFDVVGLAPAAHTEQAPVHPSAGPGSNGRSIIFQTPSGNIGCAMTRANVICNIFKFSWSPPPVPADCEYPASPSWGHAIELTPHGHTFLCTDGAVVDPGGGGFPTLQYGKAVGRGPFACESREQALVCVTKGGQGILISVQKLKLF
jgi:hypothetical protein